MNESKIENNQPTLQQHNVSGRFSIGDKVKLVDRHDWVTSNSRKGSIGIVVDCSFSFPRYVIKVKVKNGYHNGYEWWWEDNVVKK